MVSNMTDPNLPELSNDEVAQPTPQKKAGPEDWPWPSLETALTFVLVAGATLFLLVSLEPSRWFSSTTPTGGDMGAHVWSPAYLRDVLLPNFRLTGWSPDWYAAWQWSISRTRRFQLKSTRSEAMRAQSLCSMGWLTQWVGVYR